MKKAHWLAGWMGWSLALSVANGQAPVRLGLPADADTDAPAVVAPAAKAPVDVPFGSVPKPAVPELTPPKRFEIVVEQSARPESSNKKGTPAKLVGEGDKKTPLPKRMPLADGDSKTTPAPAGNSSQDFPLTVTTPSSQDPQPLPSTALSTFCAECGLPRMHVWLAPEYLYWQTRGMQTPPLLTQAPAGAIGTLDNPATAVLQGNERILDEFRSGVLLRGGVWFNADATLGVDASGFWLGKQGHDFNANSNGSPGLFRPLIFAGGVPAVTPVAFLNPFAIPGQLVPFATGSATLSATTDLAGADANFRVNMASTPLLRIDGLLGYRYLRLRDTFAIRTDSIFANPAATLIVQDRFDTTNEFHGPQIGLNGEARRGPWTLGASLKLAMGNTRRETYIDGDTLLNAGTPAADRLAGGMLAQTSNMGTHINNDFCVIPEVGVTMGLFVTENLRLSAGWNFLYWSQVGRATEQIDLNIGQLPPTPPGPVGPIYQNNNTDFWAHGFRAGVEWKY